MAVGEDIGASQGRREVAEEGPEERDLALFELWTEVGQFRGVCADGEVEDAVVGRLEVVEVLARRSCALVGTDSRSEYVRLV